MCESTLDTLDLALRETYWQHIPEGSDDSSDLLDVLASHELADGLSHDQLKAFFVMIPHKLFALAVSWGISDTVFRDELYVFVENNRERTEAVLLAAANPPEYPIVGASAVPVIRIPPSLQTKDPEDDVILNCWSCRKSMSAGERRDADGDCPHCGVEIDLNC